jgi:hypothetical protein
LEAGRVLRPTGPSGLARLHQSGLVTEDDRLHTVAQPQLCEDVHNVGLDGRLAEEERAGDLRRMVARGRPLGPTNPEFSRQPGRPIDA